jgi:hypothetical protein
MCRVSRLLQSEMDWILMLSLSMIFSGSRLINSMPLPATTASRRDAVYPVN